MPSTATTVRGGRQQLADRHRHRRLDVVDVVGHPAEQFAALAGIEVRQRGVDGPSPRRRRAARAWWRAFDDVGSRACSHTSSAATRYRPSASNRFVRTAPEIHAVAGDHVHAGQQIGEGVIAAFAAAAIACSLLRPAGSCRPITVEQQIGRMAQDPRADHSDPGMPSTARTTTVRVSPRCGVSRRSRRPTPGSPWTARRSLLHAQRTAHRDAHRCSPTNRSDGLRLGELGVGRASSSSVA